MTLFQVVRGLEEIALTHPNVRTAKDGSIYEIMNSNPSIDYTVFVVTQNTHRTDETFDYYGLTLFYVDRLQKENGMDANRLQIQSHGQQVLKNIVHLFCDEYDVDLPTLTFTPFTQKFADETAGVYCQFEFEIIKDIVCAEEY